MSIKLVQRYFNFFTTSKKYDRSNSTKWAFFAVMISSFEINRFPSSFFFTFGKKKKWGSNSYHNLTSFTVVNADEQLSLKVVHSLYFDRCGLTDAQADFTSVMLPVLNHRNLSFSIRIIHTWGMKPIYICFSISNVS